MKTIREILSGAVEALGGVSDTPRLDAELLLCEVLDCNRVLLHREPERVIKAVVIDKFDVALKRRVANEPIAYIIGKREFFGREFAVTPKVLVPRPETELLVELALSFLKERPKADVLDLGTGSGCIPITIACEAEVLGYQPNIVALDKSKEALEIAKINASTFHVADKISFLESTWFSNVTGKKFDLITANPPYVARGSEVSPETKYEPELALYSALEGLEDIYKILFETKTHLSDGGRIFIEIGHDQKERISDFLEKNCDNLIYKFHKDLAQIDRVVEIVSRKSLSLNPK